MTVLRRQDEIELAKAQAIKDYNLDDRSIALALQFTMKIMQRLDRIRLEMQNVTHQAFENQVISLPKEGIVDAHLMITRIKEIIGFDEGPASYFEERPDVIK